MGRLPSSLCVYTIHIGARARERTTGSGRIAPSRESGQRVLCWPVVLSRPPIVHAAPVDGHCKTLAPASAEGLALARMNNLIRVHDLEGLGLTPALRRRFGGRLAQAGVTLVAFSPLGLGARSNDTR